MSPPLRSMPVLPFLLSSSSLHFFFRKSIRPTGGAITVSVSIQVLFDSTNCSQLSQPHWTLKMLLYRKSSQRAHSDRLHGDLFTINLVHIIPEVLDSFNDPTTKKLRNLWLTNRPLLHLSSQKRMTCHFPNFV